MAASPDYIEKEVYKALQILEKACRHLEMEADKLKDDGEGCLEEKKNG